MAAAESHVFSFRAIGRDGRIETGSLEAATETDATASLNRRGLFPVEVRARGRAAGRRAPASAGDLALGLRILADLLDAGLPMTRALQAFEDLAPPVWRRALPEMQRSVKEGRTLTASLAAAPIEIPPVTLGILHAGEAGTGLVEAVRRAAEIAETNAATRAAIRSALAYPAVVALAGLGAIGVLLGVVLPRFALVLADLGQTLPRSTQIVLALSGIARVAFLPACAAIVIGLVAHRGWTSTEQGRRRWHELLLGVPLVGGFRHAMTTSRVSTSLAAMLEIGVPIAAALEHSARASGDAAIEQRVTAARSGIARGEPLAMALERTNAVTPTALRLVRAGEQSGRLVGMLRHAAKLEHDRADRAVKTVIRLLEPILLLCFATLVAAVAGSLLQAIYSVRPAG